MRWSLVRFQPGSQRINDLGHISRLTLIRLSGFCRVDGSKASPSAPAAFSSA